MDVFEFDGTKSQANLDKITVLISWMPSSCGKTRICWK